MRILTRIECRSLENSWIAVGWRQAFEVAPLEIRATCSQQTGQLLIA